MQNNTTSPNENLVIYSNADIDLNFFDPAIENLRPLDIAQTSLSELPLSPTDKVAIIIVDDLAELTAITIGCEHSIVITAKNTLTITPDGLSHALIYQQSADENPQQALEKVFHGLVKFCFSTTLFLDPSDIYQSDAFEKGQRRINTHHLNEQQLVNDDVKTLLSPIRQNDTVILNFNLNQSSFSVNKVNGLTQIIIDHLGEHFDGEIIFSCAVSSQHEHSNMIYVHYLSS